MPVCLGGELFSAVMYGRARRGLKGRLWSDLREPRTAVCEKTVTYINGHVQVNWMKCLVTRPCCRMASRFILKSQVSSCVGELALSPRCVSTGLIVSTCSPLPRLFLRQPPQLQCLCVKSGFPFHFTIIFFILILLPYWSGFVCLCRYRASTISLVV